MYLRACGSFKSANIKNYLARNSQIRKVPHFRKRKLADLLFAERLKIRQRNIRFVIFHFSDMYSTFIQLTIISTSLNNNNILLLDKLKEKKK
jgi:hypothetical protein